MACRLASRMISKKPDTPLRQRLSEGILALMRSNTPPIIDLDFSGANAVRGTEWWGGEGPAQEDTADKQSAPYFTSRKAPKTQPSVRSQRRTWYQSPFCPAIVSGLSV